ncbi:hypothetical protein M9H77_10614 [Catharanthus roseus]|uniref:Uncharacterized protein n=1 Tax=Catharanthus roseus TaxID=4058 RepID=A0ACC0BC67_CATRO|nr:hypothetical protein M9H77_10614 [Catharanthus roseus]
MATAARLVVILLPLLALFFSATYVTATRIAPAPAAVEEGSIETVCKNTYDDQYCVHLLKPLVIPTTNFSSLKWNRAVLSKAITRARIAREFMTKHAQGSELGFKQHSVLKDCLDNMDTSVELLQLAAREYVEVYNKFYGILDFELHKSYVKSLMETASYELEICNNSLQGSKIEVMSEVKSQADGAYKANKIAADVVLSVNVRGGIKP